MQPPAHDAGHAKLLPDVFTSPSSSTSSHLLPAAAAWILHSPQEPSVSMATETVVLKVAMSCEGCSGAVKRVLSKMQGVESFDIDMKEQKVTVKGNVKPEDVFQTVSKTGKKTSFWEAEAAAPSATAEVPAATTAEAAPSATAEAPAATTAAAEITPAKADA